MAMYLNAEMGSFRSTRALKRRGSGMSNRQKSRARQAIAPLLDALEKLA